MQELTPKDAVEKLLREEPDSWLIRKMKRDGTLDDILYPDRDQHPVAKGGYNRMDDEERRGREEGSSTRSLAAAGRRGGRTPAQGRVQPLLVRAENFYAQQPVKARSRRGVDSSPFSPFPTASRSASDTTQQPHGSFLRSGDDFDFDFDRYAMPCRCSLPPLASSA
jgi:hypothetical protein